MTSAVVTSEQKVERDPLRLLSISANLLPQEIIDARRANKMRWLVIGVLVVVIGALVGWDIQARQSTDSAQSELTQAQLVVDRVTAQQKDYLAASTAKSQAAAIQSQLQQLMAGDLPWWQLLPSIGTAATKAGVTVDNVTAAVQTDASATSLAPTNGIPAAVPSIGQVTISGSAKSQPAIAAYLDLLAKTHGLVGPFLSADTGLNGAIRFNIEVGFTAALLQGRFSTTTGGK